MAFKIVYAVNVWVSAWIYVHYVCARTHRNQKKALETLELDFRQLLDVTAGNRYTGFLKEQQLILLTAQQCYQLSVSALLFGMENHS